MTTEAIFYEELGSRIRAARQQSCLSQQDLADALGYEAGGSVGKWESGAQRPSVYILLRMESVLDVKLHDC